MLIKLRSPETTPFHIKPIASRMGFNLEFFILIDIPRAEARDTCEFLTYCGWDYTNADSLELDALKYRLYSTSMNSQYLKYHAAGVI